MSERRRTYAGRDQGASAFGAVLMRLCDSVGAFGAALVDGEGETVDYAGTSDPFDIRVAAAEWVVVLDLLRRSPVRPWADTQELIVRGARRSFYLRALEDGYAVVLLLPAHAFRVSPRALVEAVRDLCAEAGLRIPRTLARERWTLVQVKTVGKARRPRAVWLDGRWSPLEVLGYFTDDLLPREIAFRTRLESGAELTLVRERLGRWYADWIPEAGRARG